MATALDLIKGSMKLIGAIAAGETPSANESADALAGLNRMLSEWGNEGLLVPSVTREAFSLVAAQSSYTMGTGGNFNTTRPTSIVQVGLVDGTTEYPVEIITAEQYGDIVSKSTSAERPSRIYPSGSFPLETLILWPIPSAVKSLAIYSLKPIASFSLVSDSVSLPPGYEKAIIYNLAMDMAPEYGRDPSALVAATAQETKANLMRKNLKPTYMSSDLAGGKQFNILTGEQMRFAGFIGPAYQLPSVNVDCQQCINLYIEMNENGKGKENEIAFLKSTPGLELLASVGSGPIRMIHIDPLNRIFVASGSEMYELDPATWLSTLLGSLETATGIISAASTQIGDDAMTVFVDGLQNYLFWYDASGPTETFGTFADFAYAPVVGATHVVFVDGYFIFNIDGSNLFYVTEWNTFNVDPLSFASAEGNPDSIVAMIANHRDLWLLNEKTIELFSNTGNADFPFERVQGGFIEKGCVAKFSVAKIEGVIFWLGRDESGQGIVYAAQNLSPQRISTHAIESTIQEYVDMSAAVAYTYQSGGHAFYVLSFAEATWVYDLTTKLWHERAYTNMGALERHRGQVHAFDTQYSVHLIGDYANEKIYKFNDSYYSDDTVEITRRRSSPHVSNGAVKLFHKKFQLDMETGVGLVTGQGSDPQVMLQWSDDGGHTWSDESWTSAGGQVGGIGEYKKRVLWRRLGSSRDRVYRATITDPVPVTLIGADIDIEGGQS